MRSNSLPYSDAIPLHQCFPFNIGHAVNGWCCMSLAIFLPILIITITTATLIIATNWMLGKVGFAGCQKSLIFPATSSKSSKSSQLEWANQESDALTVLSSFGLSYCHIWNGVAGMQQGFACAGLLCATVEPRQHGKFFHTLVLPTRAFQYGSETYNIHKVGFSRSSVILHGCFLVLHVSEFLFLVFQSALRSS